MLTSLECFDKQSYIRVTSLLYSTILYFILFYLHIVFLYCHRTHKNSSSTLWLRTTVFHVTYMTLFSSPLVWTRNMFNKESCMVSEVLSLANICIFGSCTFARYFCQRRQCEVGGRVICLDFILKFFRFLLKFRIHLYYKKWILIQRKLAKVVAELNSL